MRLGERRGKEVIEREGKWKREIKEDMVEERKKVKGGGGRGRGVLTKRPWTHGTHCFKCVHHSLQKHHHHQLELIPQIGVSQGAGRLGCVCVCVEVCVRSTFSEGLK